MRIVSLCYCTYHRTQAGYVQFLYYPTGQVGGAFPPYFWMVQVFPSCQAASVQQAGNWPRTLRVSLDSPAADAKSIIGALTFLSMTQRGNVTRSQGYLSN